VPHMIHHVERIGVGDWIFVTSLSTRFFIAGRPCVRNGGWKLIGNRLCRV